jgi:hypothetical protein
MKCIESIPKLFKSLGYITSIIVWFVSGVIRAFAYNSHSMLSFKNIHQKNLVHIFNNSYICQEFESLAYIGICQANLMNGGHNFKNLLKDAAAHAAIFHLYN